MNDQKHRNVTTEYQSKFLMPEIFPASPNRSHSQFNWSANQKLERTTSVKTVWSSVKSQDFGHHSPKPIMTDKRMMLGKIGMARQVPHNPFQKKDLRDMT
jgi:hypothetical protein